MKDILPELEDWLTAGEKIALATVVRTWGSSPRGVGAKMALTPGGKITGSVSGGCVEGAVYEAGIETLATGQPQLLHFGVADETAWSVGLACGGQIDVFVQPLQASAFDSQRNLLASGQPFASATVILGPAGLPGCQMIVTETGSAAGSIDAALDHAVINAARKALKAGESQVIQVQDSPEVEIFLEITGQQLVLVIVGGVHIAIALTQIARVLGFHTVVIDPRKAFGNTGRFPNADQLVQAWPDDAFASLAVTGNTAVAILTHDPKIDDPALIAALNSPAFYVGALGSTTTQAKRRERLLQARVSEQQLSRLHGPIGLKSLGARTPEEIALAVMAEIITARNQ